MNSCLEHYEALLAARYTWMHGGHGAKVEEQIALFAALGIAEGKGAAALDLGCGSGFQSIALARLGYRVMAVDQSRRLLEELAREGAGLDIRAVCGDLRDCRRFVPEGCRLVVCMGDTLTHLEHHDEVRALCRDLAAGLASGARAVFTWRDLAAELTGIDRFIPVRADPDRIMTCFLEYEPQRVIVHDLVHERDGESWALLKSSYAKLRLPLGWLVDEIAAAGFAIEVAQPGRFATLVARRAEGSV